MKECPSCHASTAAARFCDRCGYALGTELPPPLPHEVLELSGSGEHPAMPAALPLEPATAPDPESTLPPERSRADQIETRAGEPDYHQRVGGGPWLSEATSAHEQDRLGSVIAGRYRLEAILGVGGFGVVYRATHLALGEPVALKLLHAEWAVQPEFRTRFRREAVALARLRHPGIVSVHDFGEVGGRPFLVMDAVSGASLAQLVAAGPQALPPARVTAIFDQVLAVVEVAHAAGIIHRDLKPDNVLVAAGSGGSDAIKVLDFGIALLDDQEHSQRLTSTNTVQGTPLYMSPEQCRGRHVGPATDIYAVGAMLYEALAGVPPFAGDTATDIMVKHMFMPPAPLAQRGWQRPAPAPLEALVVWALAKRAEDRPSAAALRAALSRVAHGDDEVSRSERSHAGRVAELERTREARGLPPPSPSQAATLPRPAPGGPGPLLVLWELPPVRAEALRAALAVNGIEAVPWDQPEAPPAELDGQAVRAVVVGGAGAEARARALRGPTGAGGPPLLVVDVVAAEAIAGLVRAGASDATLAELGDDAVCVKAWRLIQRGR